MVDIYIYQVYAQFTILYVVEGSGPGQNYKGFIKIFRKVNLKLNQTEKPIDLSNLLYDEGTNIQKLHYFSFLSSSIINMGLELAKILTWGKNPIVSRLKSFTFLKIFVFILTKLYINVYILSVIVKSLMFQLVFKDHMIVAGSPKLEELLRKVNKKPKSTE